jgi:hypothetical protein
MTSTWRFLFLSLLAGCSTLPVKSQSQPSASDARRVIEAAGVPTDWTHRHVVFSSPPANSEAQQQIERDPRYWIHLRNHGGSQDLDADDTARDHDRDEDDRRHRKERERKPMEGDWNEALNTGFSSYTTAKYPAKYSFNTSTPMPNCVSDYVVYILGSSASSTFNIIAFSNLYLNSGGGASFCAGANPTLLFAYFASTGGASAGPLSGSPVLSLDGTQIAFVESAGTGGIFHVLKWQAAASTPAFPGTTGTLQNCASINTPPCEYSFAYAGTHTATRSSPFVDYGTDTAYLTDNAGNVYAISPVFGGGTPAMKSGWPAAGVSVGTGAPLTAPVYDSVTRRIFAGDTNGNLYYINSTGTCGVKLAPCAGGSVSVSSASATVQPPIIDSTTQKVFVFSNGAPTGSGVIGASVVQTDTSLGHMVVAGIGGGAVNTIWSGDFNHTYYASGSSAAGAALYACGDNIISDAPVLYAFPFTSSPSAGTLSTTALAGSPLFLTTSVVSPGACSALADNYNKTTNNDRIFVGVTKNCVSGETTGCVLAYDITSGFPSAPSAHFAEPGGTSGIIVDNVADQGGGTQLTTDVYFLNAGNQTCTVYSGGTNSGNCAVSLTQSTLH